MIEIIGKEYQERDENGFAMGCMYPVYYMYPFLKSTNYNYPEDRSKLGEYLKEKFDKHLLTVDFENIAKGDIMLIDYGRRLLHPAIFIGNGEMLHCMELTGVEICRLPPKHRIKGVYRCQPDIHFLNLSEK